MVVSLVQFRSSHKKYMLGFCLANLLQSCGKQATHNMDRVLDADATTPAHEKDAAKEGTLVQTLSKLVANKDSQALEDLLKSYSKEALIEGLKGLNLGPIAVNAVEHHQLQVIELLLDAGVSIETKDNDSTLLDIAASMNDPNLVNMLVARGAYIEATNSQGITPILTAANQGHIEVIKVLLEGGANLKALKCVGGALAVSAATMNHLEGLAMLFDHLGVSTETMDVDHNTLLHIAARNGYTDMVKMLIDRKVNIEAMDKLGNTPLHIAALSRHINLANR